MTERMPTRHFVVYPQKGALKGQKWDVLAAPYEVVSFFSSLLTVD